MNLHTEAVRNPFEQGKKGKQVMAKNFKINFSLTQMIKNNLNSNSEWSTSVGSLLCSENEPLIFF